MKILAVLILLLAASASSGAAEKICSEEYKLAASAVFYRDEGLTQEQLRWPLPPRAAANKDPQSPASIKLLLMHQIVDEIFLARGVGEEVYATYKAEQCYRNSLGKPTPSNFQLIIPQLMQCQRLSKRRKVSCAMRVAGS